MSAREALTIVLREFGQPEHHIKHMLAEIEHTSEVDLTKQLADDEIEAFKGEARKAFHERFTNHLN
jgi:hypothetical protein